MTLYYDLNVMTDSKDEQATLRMLSDLGYHVVALSTTLTSSKRPSGPASKVKEYGKLKVLRRANIIVNDTSDIALISSSQTTELFDIVAVTPTNDKLLQMCLQADGVDIVSLDVSNRQLFYVKRPHVHVAQAKGIVFEFCYSSGLRGHEELRNFVSNCSQIASVADSSSIIFSSGAQHVMELRAPLDVLNLGTLMSISDVGCRNAVSVNAQHVVQHGHVRRTYHQGIVKVSKLNDNTTASSATAAPPAAPTS